MDENQKMSENMQADPQVIATVTAAVLKTLQATGGMNAAPEKLDQQEGKGSTPASNPPETSWPSPACSEGVQPGAGVCRAHGHLLALLTTGSGANSRAGSPRGGFT